MSISQAGLDMIKQFEGFSPTPYRDATGWSIGFGHYMGSAPTIQSVDLASATDLLIQDTVNADQTVNNNVTVPLTQNQHDALVSFVYNVGAGNFEKSTLLKLLNQGDYQGAADQFNVWNKTRSSSGVMMTSATLSARRETEKQLFLS